MFPYWKLLFMKTRFFRNRDIYFKHFKSFFLDAEMFIALRYDMKTLPKQKKWKKIQENITF